MAQCSRSLKNFLPPRAQRPLIIHASTILLQGLPDAVLPRQPRNSQHQTDGKTQRQAFHEIFKGQAIGVGVHRGMCSGRSKRFSGKTKSGDLSPAAFRLLQPLNYLLQTLATPTLGSSGNEVERWLDIRYGRGRVDKTLTDLKVVTGQELCSVSPFVAPTASS